MDKLPKIALPTIFILIALVVLISKSAVTIGSGEAGVLYRLLGSNKGVVTDEPPLGEGFHLVFPLNQVHVYEVREQSKKVDLPLLSVDGLPIKVETTIQFKPDTKNLGFLHQKIGSEYYDRKVKPSINSAGRSVVGRYTAEELYSSKREAIQNEIEEETRNELEGTNIELIKILVEGIELPPKILGAIEEKLSQEQESKKYKYLLEKAAKEAEKVTIEAQGKADANRILSASLTDKILQDKGIDATLRLSESPNAKVIVVGGGDAGLPLILGNN